MKKLGLILGVLLVLPACTKKSTDVHVIHRVQETIYEPVNPGKIPSNKTENDYKTEKSIISDMRKRISHKSFTTIHVHVQNGLVKFTGIAKNTSDIVKCMDIAWSKKGVKEVDNYVEVKNDDFSFDVTQYTKDAWITAAVKAQLLIGKNIRSRNFTITTDQNIVYVFGISDSQYEIQEIGAIASKVKGVQKVVINVTLLK